MTLYIVIITSIISILAFNNREVFSRLTLNPYQVYHRNEHYRMISHALVHADWIHLIINMFVLYSFGRLVEHKFMELHYRGLLNMPSLYFIFFYLTSIIIASVSTLHKYRDNVAYNSVGASGGVSAILFCAIFFYPWEMIYFYGIIPMPGILFGIAYLFYSRYMGKKGGDYINHDAHYWGAVYGMVFPIFISISLLFDFFHQIITLGQ